MEKRPHEKVELGRRIAIIPSGSHHKIASRMKNLPGYLSDKHDTIPPISLKFQFICPFKLPLLKR
jgi:hypothetical protein